MQAACDESQEGDKRIIFLFTLVIGFCIAPLSFSKAKTTKWNRMKTASNPSAFLLLQLIIHAFHEVYYVNDEIITHMKL